MRRQYLSGEGDFASVERDAELHRQRVTQHASTYTQQTAQELINAAMSWPWLHPQLVATLVLSGNSDLLEPVAKHSLSQMAKTGLDWGERRFMVDGYRRAAKKFAQPLTTPFDTEEGF